MCTAQSVPCVQFPSVFECAVAACILLRSLCRSMGLPGQAFNPTMKQQVQPPPPPISVAAFADIFCPIVGFLDCAEMLYGFVGFLYFGVAVR